MVVLPLTRQHTTNPVRPGDEHRDEGFVLGCGCSDNPRQPDKAQQVHRAPRCGHEYHTHEPLGPTHPWYLFPHTPCYPWPWIAYGRCLATV